MNLSPETTISIVTLISILGVILNIVSTNHVLTKDNVNRAKEEGRKELQLENVEKQLKELTIKVNDFNTTNKNILLDIVMLKEQDKYLLEKIKSWEEWKKEKKHEN